MDGLNCFGCDEIGFDWMQLAKGAAGALEGVGDMMNMDDAAKKKAADDKSKPPTPPPPPPKASMSAGTIALIGIGSLLGITGIVALARR